MNKIFYLTSILSLISCASGATGDIWTGLNFETNFVQTIHSPHYFTPSYLNSTQYINCTYKTWWSAQDSAYRGNLTCFVHSCDGPPALSIANSDGNNQFYGIKVLIANPFQTNRTLYECTGMHVTYWDGISTYEGIYRAYNCLGYFYNLTGSIDSEYGESTYNSTKPPLEIFLLRLGTYPPYDKINGYKPTNWGFGVNYDISLNFICCGSWGTQGYWDDVNGSQWQPSDKGAWRLSSAVADDLGCYKNMTTTTTSTTTTTTASTTSTTTTTIRTLRLLFVPVNWDDTGGFRERAEEHAKFFVDALPTADCLEHTVDSSDEGCVSSDVCGSNASCCWGELRSCISGYLSDKSADYDFIVALGGDGGKCSPTGFTFRDSRATIVYSNDEKQADATYANQRLVKVTAHELGHLLGLNNEYCSKGENCNLPPNTINTKICLLGTLECYYSLDEGCCWINDDCCGNPSTKPGDAGEKRCLMSQSNWAGYSYCSKCIDHILHGDTSAYANLRRVRCE